MVKKNNLFIKLGSYKDTIIFIISVLTLTGFILTAILKMYVTPYVNVAIAGAVKKEVKLSLTETIKNVIEENEKNHEEKSALVIEFMQKEFDNRTKDTDRRLDELREDVKELKNLMLEIIKKE